MTASAAVAAAAAPALRARGLRCALGGTVVFDGLDLEVAPGRFVGVFGANGAGKTTLLRALLGLVPLQRGEFTLLGEPGPAARSQIGYVAQRDPLGADATLSVRSVLAAAWQAQRWGTGWRQRRQRAAAVAQALQTLDLQELADRPVGALSGGQRQRARIAQALVNPVQMLFLDEPLSNLDPQAQQRILQVVRALCDERGLTVLMTAHDINALLPYMDEVLYLANGRGRLGTVDQVVNADTLSALYGLPMAVARDGGYVFIHPVGGFAGESGHCCGHDLQGAGS